MNALLLVDGGIDVVIIRATGEVDFTKTGLMASLEVIVPAVKRILHNNIKSSPLNHSV